MDKIMHESSSGFKIIEEFYMQNNLRQTISDFEFSLRQKNLSEINAQLREKQFDPDVLMAALELKDIVGQINTIIHAWGILVSLPYILSQDEQVEYVSLGAGNTGKKFDLKTSRRVAEFKFISWKGGSESIRQNGLFKDFYNLVENGGNLEKYLYVTGTEHPIRFFKGSRDLKSVLSKDRLLSDSFFKKYGNKYTNVNEFYNEFKDSIKIVDLQTVVPEFSKDLAGRKKLTIEKNVEIKVNIQNLRDYFSRFKTDSGYKPTKRQKFNKWVKEFDQILEQIGKIETIVSPKLKVDLGYPFTDGNLVLNALFQPSAKKIFSEIKKEFNSLSSFIVSYDDLELLESCSDRANTLAWIGDASIKYAISSKIWKLDISTEDLNDTRKMYENNENFSLLCDRWQLFQSRINLDPEDEKPTSAYKIKGTLVEAIFGVIYIEKGLKGVEEALYLIDKSLK